MRLLDCSFCGTAITEHESEALVEEGYATLIMCKDQAGCLHRMDLMDPDVGVLPGMVLA